MPIKAKSDDPRKKVSLSHVSLCIRVGPNFRVLSKILAFSLSVSLVPMDPRKPKNANKIKNRRPSPKSEFAPYEPMHTGWSKFSCFVKILAFSNSVSFGS